MYMLEEIDKVLSKMREATATPIGYYYLIDIKNDWIANYGYADLERELVKNNYGRMFIDLIREWK